MEGAAHQPVLVRREDQPFGQGFDVLCLGAVLVGKVGGVENLVRRNGLPQQGKGVVHALFHAVRPAQALVVGVNGKVGQHEPRPGLQLCQSVAKDRRHVFDTPLPELRFHARVLRAGRVQGIGNHAGHVGQPVHGGGGEGDVHGITGDALAVKGCPGGQDKDVAVVGQVLGRRQRCGNCVRDALEHAGPIVRLLVFVHKFDGVVGSASQSVGKCGA